MKVHRIGKILSLSLALALAACDPGKPTEPASLFGTDIVEAKPVKSSYGITEGQTAQVQLKFQRKTKVRAYVNWEIRGGIGRFLRPTGVVPVEADVDLITLPLETFRNETIEDPTDFEVVINSDSFAAPVTVLINVTDLTQPAVVQISTPSPFSLPTTGVDTQVSGTITLRNNGEVSARALTPSAFTDPQIYFLGGFFPGTGGTCSAILPAGSSCTVVVAAKMTAAGSIEQDLKFTYNSGLATVEKLIKVRAASDSIIASLTGLPNSISKDANLNVTVGGYSIVNYKYKVGDLTMKCEEATGYMGPSPIASVIGASLSAFPDGNMKLCVVGINAGGTQQQFAAATFYTWYKDTTPPEIQGTAPNFDGTLVINNGAVRTRVTSVNLALNANGSQFMYITNTPGCTSGGMWEIYNEAKSWTISYTNNTNRVYAKFRDALGNETPCVNAAITHDDTPPTVVINQDGAQADPTLTVPITYIADFSEEVVPGTFTPEAVEQTGSANNVVWQITKVTATRYKVEAISVGVGGTVIPKLKTGQITDLAGNYSLESSSIDASVTYNLIEFYFKSFTLGAQHSCGFSNDGKIYCWGSNADYQLGMPRTNPPPPAPAPDPGPIYPVGFTKPTLFDYSALTGITFKKMVAGSISSCAIGSNRKLYCWGKDTQHTSGQGVADYYNGNFYKIDQPVPKEIRFEQRHFWGCADNYKLDTALTFTDVSIGKTHICAIDTNFNVGCFGYIPVRGEWWAMPACVEPGLGKPGGVNPKQISSGGFGTCAVNGKGQAYCFGINDQGQVGDGTYTNRADFTAVNVGSISGFDGFAQVSAGDNHVCGVGNNGKVYCWGRGTEGQLGNGAYANRNTPAQIDTSSLGPIAFVEVKVGEKHSCARTSKGKVYCWGDGNNGKLGSSLTGQQPTPVLVVAPTGSFENIVSLETGANHACGLMANGKLFCWGAQSTEGRLGNGTTSDVLKPVVVDVNGLLSKRALVSISAGTDNTCAVGSDAKVYCWGAGATGKLGDGITDRMTPREINGALVGGMMFVQVSTGRAHSCGLTTAGRAYCWGQNNEGQLGDGTTASSVTPVAVDVNVYGLNDPATPEDDFLGFKSISVGHSHTCALHADGRAFCWGYGLFGQLGSSSILSQSRPQQVNTGPAGIARFVQIDVGDHHGCGISPAGKAYCWGWGSLGRLGDNGTTDRLTPVLVNTTLNSDITANTDEVFNNVSAGSEHTCVTTLGKRMYCWGNGTEGRLGNYDPTYATKLTPATLDLSVIGAFSRIATIDAGREHSCLTTDTGTLACWGTGTKGRLGDGAFLFRSRPVPVNFSGVASYGGSWNMTAGGSHSCALGILGEQYCWGEGLSGRLGNSANENQGVPVNILFP